jgi:hypothetical protein
VATKDNVFRNTIVDDTKHDDGISQVLRDVEGGFLGARQLKKLDIEKGLKTPLYQGCLVSKLQADIMLLEFKSTHGLSDKGFDDLLCVSRKLLLDPSELQEKT